MIARILARVPCPRQMPSARPLASIAQRPVLTVVPRGQRSVVSASASPGIDLEFNVSGMMCESCTSRVEEELAKKDKVDTVKADLDQGVVTVTVQADDLATAAGMMEDIINEINSMGFEATPNL